MKFFQKNYIIVTCLLPNLKKLTIRFSNISLLNENEFCEENRYQMLKELNLNCNNLDSFFRNNQTYL